MFTNLTGHVSVTIAVLGKIQTSLFIMVQMNIRLVLRRALTRLMKKKANASGSAQLSLVNIYQNAAIFILATKLQQKIYLCNVVA